MRRIALFLLVVPAMSFSMHKKRANSMPSLSVSIKESLESNNKTSPKGSPRQTLKDSPRGQRIIEQTHSPRNDKRDCGPIISHK